MKVKINCQPEPQIQWFKGGSDVTKSSAFKITKDPNGFDTLIISSASRSSAGEFEVKATNEMGTTSSKCTIKVNSKAKLFKLDFVKSGIVFSMRFETFQPNLPVMTLMMWRLSKMTT